MILAYADRGVVRRHLRHQRMHVGARRHRQRPVRMAEALQVAAAHHNVDQVPAPAFAPFIAGYSVQHGSIGHLLQIKIKRGVHAQACLMYLLGTVLLLQLAAHLLHKPWRNGVWWRLNAQPQRCGFGSGGLLGCDGAVLQHRVQHQIAPFERAVGRANGRVVFRPLWQRRKQRSLGQRQVMRMF